MRSSASNRTKSNTARSIFTRLWACRLPYSTFPLLSTGPHATKPPCLDLEAFRAALAKLDFPGVRMVYTNFALRAVLRALYAIEHRERDCFNGVFNRLS